MYAISTVGATIASVTGFLLKYRRPAKQNCYSNATVTNYVPQISYNGQCVPLETAFIVPKKVKGITGETRAPQLYYSGSIQTSEIKTIGPFECTCTEGLPAPSLSTVAQGQCYTMECKNTTGYTGQLYIEASGGLGGNFSFYDSNGKKVTYVGGTNGTVFGTINIKPQDILIVHFGYDAEPVTTTELSNGIYNNTPGNGGSGAILGGSNGGGSTSIYLNGKLILLAGGGGGASRNASGGSSGSSGVMTYKLVHPNPNPNGQPGGNLYQSVNIAPLNTAPNGISGGGATISKGGIGLDTKGLPFVGSNASESNYGGGGGGSGYFGGAAGSWNGALKPNNLHGAGGGGSSFIDSSVYFSSETKEGIYPWNRNTNNGTSSYIVFGYSQQSSK
jgi:hypothetical protein